MERLAEHPGLARGLFRSVREGAVRRVATALARPGPPADDEPPVALVLGKASPGSTMDRLARLLETRRWRIARRPWIAPAAASRLAAQLPPVKAMLIGDPRALDTAPFALSPSAIWIAEAGVRHPAVALTVGSGGVGHGALDLARPAEVLGAIEQALFRSAMGWRDRRRVVTEGRSSKANSNPPEFKGVTGPTRELANELPAG